MKLGLSTLSSRLQNFFVASREGRRRPHLITTDSNIDADLHLVEGLAAKLADFLEKGAVLPDAPKPAAAVEEPVANRAAERIREGIAR